MVVPQQCFKPDEEVVRYGCKKEYRPDYRQSWNF